MAATGPVLENAVIQISMVSVPPTPSAWNGLHSITCILMLLAPASHTKLPLPAKSLTADHSGARALLHVFSSLAGHPETSARIFFFGSCHPPVGTAIPLGSALLQTLPLMRRCTWVARYRALGTDRRPAHVLCLRTGLDKVANVATLPICPLIVCFHFAVFTLQFSLSLSLACPP